MQIKSSGFRRLPSPSQRTRTAALGLWEGLSHSASLRSIVIVLKSHSALLRSIVIFLKVVSAKTNLREKIWNTSLKLRVYCPTKVPI